MVAQGKNKYEAQKQVEQRRVRNIENKLDNCRCATRAQIWSHKKVKRF